MKLLHQCSDKVILIVQPFCLNVDEKKFLLQEMVGPKKKERKKNSALKKQITLPDL